MADPARYTVDPVLNEGSQTAGLHTERTPYGEWVKWHDFQDYKDAQRRNKSEATAVKLGLEVVSLNNRIEELTAENERLRKAGDAMYDFAVQDSLGYWVMPPFQRWGKEHHSRNAAKEGRDAK